MFIRSFTTASLILLIGSGVRCASSTSAPYRTHSAQGGRFPLNNASEIATPTQLASNATLQTATDYAAANKCWSDWEAYSGWATSCPKTTITGSVYTLSDEWTTTEYKTYSLCDGHPRAVAHGDWRTSYSTMSDITYPFQTISLTTITVEFPPSGIPAATITTTTVHPETDLVTTCATPAPEPRCTVDNENCQSLFSAWTAGGFTRRKPPCYYPEPGDPCDACALYVPSVKLLYFPVSMTGDFCGDDYHTATPAHRGNLSTPTTVVWSGTTLTSGSVYLSYAGVTAMATGKGCGTPKPAGLLPLPSSELFSYRGHAAAMPIMGDHQWPFNFADLAPNPVPWDAWISQDLCYNHQDWPSCQTVTQAAYRPWLVYPKEFFAMDPAWSKCVTGAFGIMDPPTALPKADVQVVPTMSSEEEPTSTAAAPGTSVRITSPQTAAPSLETTKLGKAQPPRGSSSPDPVASAADPGRSSQEGNKPGGKHETEDTNTLSKAGAADASSSALADPGRGRPQSDPVDPADPADPASATRKSKDRQPQPAATFAVPTSALAHTALSFGSLVVAPGSETGAIAVGTHVLSKGEQTRIGSTFVSLGSETLVVGVLPTAPPADPEPPNALSVLSKAQTEGRPIAKVTVGGQTFTAYSAGVIVGPHTTYEPGHSVISAGEHTLTIGSNGVVVGSSTFGFNPPAKGTASPEASSVRRRPKQTTTLDIELTFVRGTSRTTVEASVDRSGHTIVSIGSNTFTYTDGISTRNGTRTRPDPNTRGRTTRSGNGHKSEHHATTITDLPSIVYGPQSSSSVSLPPIVGSQSVEPHSSSTSTTTSGAPSLMFCTILRCLQWSMIIVVLVLHLP